MASQSAASESSSLGGKNSKLIDGFVCARTPGIDLTRCSGRPPPPWCAMAVRVAQRPRRRLRAPIIRPPLRGRVRRLLVPSPLDGVDLRRRVQQCLDTELATQSVVLAELGPDVDDLLTVVADLLRGG